MLRLFRLACMNRGPMPGLRIGPILRIESPSADSTLSTSAPRSASTCVAEGPMMTVVRSMIRMPCNGPLILRALQ